MPIPRFWVVYDFQHDDFVAVGAFTKKDEAQSFADTFGSSYNGGKLPVIQRTVDEMLDGMLEYRLARLGIKLTLEQGNVKIVNKLDDLVRGHE